MPNAPFRVEPHLKGLKREMMCHAPIDDRLLGRSPRVLFEGRCRRGLHAGSNVGDRPGRLSQRGARQHFAQGAEAFCTNMGAEPQIAADDQEGKIAVWQQQRAPARVEGGKLSSVRTPGTARRRGDRMGSGASIPVQRQTHAVPARLARAMRIKIDYRLVSRSTTPALRLRNRAVPALPTDQLTDGMKVLCRERVSSFSGSRRRVQEIAGGDRSFTGAGRMPTSEEGYRKFVIVLVTSTLGNVTASHQLTPRG